MATGHGQVEGSVAPRAETKMTIRDNDYQNENHIQKSVFILKG